MYIDSTHKGIAEKDYNCDGAISSETNAVCGGGTSLIPINTNWSHSSGIHHICEFPCSATLPPGWCINSYPNEETAYTQGAGPEYYPLGCGGSGDSGGPSGTDTRWYIGCERCNNPTSQTIYW